MVNRFPDDLSVLLGLLVGAGGLFVSVAALMENTRQRKIENTFKWLNLIKATITNEHLKTFKRLYRANSPIIGAKSNFIFDDGKNELVDYMFSEGGCGIGHIQEIIEIFNLVCEILIKNDLVDRVFLFEYGQLMLTCHRWTLFLESDEGPNKKYVDEVMERGKNLNWLDKFKIKRGLKPYKEEKSHFFYHFNRYMKKNKSKIIYYKTHALDP